MKIIKLQDNVFKTEPIVIGNCSFDQLTKWVKARFPNYKPEETDASVCGTVLSLSHGRHFGRIVWVKDLSRKPEDLGVLLHELFHLVVRVMQDKGVPIVDKLRGEGFVWNGDESAAYLYECYAFQCLRKI